jgi:hypothetical protein
LTALEKTLLVIVFGFNALIFNEALSIKPPAQQFPLYVAGSTALLTLFAFGRSFLSPMRGPVFVAQRGRVVLTAAAGLVGMAFLLQFSYIIAALLFLFLGYIFLMPKRTLKGGVAAVIVTVGTTGFTWLCFSVWLGVSLP